MLGHPRIGWLYNQGAGYDYHWQPWATAGYHGAIGGSRSPQS